jgi:hypothetical protein
LQGFLGVVDVFLEGFVVEIMSALSLSASSFARALGTRYLHSGTSFRGRLKDG